MYYESFCGKRTQYGAGRFEGCEGRLVLTRFSSELRKSSEKFYINDANKNLFSANTVRTRCTLAANTQRTRSEPATNAHKEIHFL
jgi:hypothetical protein